MAWMALKMLTGNRSKYVAIVFGIAFASMLMTQQMSIFVGLMRNTSSQVRDLQGADIWVADPSVQFVDDIQPLSENDLYPVRGVPGVASAVRFYKGQGRLKRGEGHYQQVMVLGLDDATLVGAPRTIVLGSLSDLRQPDAVIMDEAGYHYLWPGESLRTGRTLEMNDHRAVIVGVCQASATFQTFPILYTGYHQALGYIPQERKAMTFVLAGAEAGLSADDVCRRITAATGRRAVTREDFKWETIHYYLKRTSIPINFGITVSLGFLVGCAVAGQLFYTFTLENLNQFGSLKAMGVSNARLIGMVLAQALVVGVIDYGLGIGLAALFGEVSKKSSQHAFYMPGQVLVGTGGAVLVIVVLASLVSIRRVLVLDPAVVFRG